ncbi:MAG TPA: DUF2339 domain-containing protein [Actinomycetota bacterium]|nr:DUF2339 domain-containing protein [Actinomycetota bacterium]
MLVVVGLGVLAHYVGRTKELEEQVHLLQQQITIMQKTLGGILRSLNSGGIQQEGIQTAPLETSAPVSQASKAPLASPSRRQTGATAESKPTPASEWTMQTPGPSRRPSRTQQELEALIGEKLLNRVGAVALILGVGFFLKYAFDRDWISPLIRVLMGMVLGAGLVALASRQRERLPIFAQGVLGAGLSILYLSAYASFGFYELVPKPLAFAMMSVVTLLTLERGRQFDSLAVALLGWAGGFLTPALLSGGTATEPSSLFVYLILLNVALLGLASMRRDWWILEPLSLVATFVNFAGWYAGSQERFRSSTIIFLCVIWALYHALDVLQEGRYPDDNQIARGVTATLNTIFFFSAIGIVLGDSGRDGLTWVALGLSVAYALPGVAMRRSIARHSLKAMVFLMTATGLQFEGFAAVELWALEAFIFLALGIFTKTPHLHRYALMSFAFTVMSLLATPDAVDRFPAVTGEYGLFNPRGFAFMAVALASGLGILLYRLPKDEDLITEVGFGRSSLHYAWTFTLFVLLTVEVLDYFDTRAGLAGISRDANVYATALVMAAVWVGYGLVLAFAGFRAKVESLGHAGLTSLVIGSITTALFAVTYVPIEEFQILANLRFAVVALTMAAAYAATQLLGKEDWHRSMALGLNIGLALLSFELLTSETRDHFQRQIAEAGSDLSTRTSGGLAISLKNKQQLAISAVWLIYSVITMTIGIARRHRGFRIASISLLMLTILKVFLYDLSFLTELYRIFSFIGLGVILLGASFAYQRYKNLIFGEESPAASA